MCLGVPRKQKLWPLIGSRCLDSAVLRKRLSIANKTSQHQTGRCTLSESSSWGWVVKDWRALRLRTHLLQTNPSFEVHLHLHKTLTSKERPTFSEKLTKVLPTGQVSLSTCFHLLSRFTWSFTKDVGGRAGSWEGSRARWCVVGCLSRFFPAALARNIQGGSGWCKSMLLPFRDRSCRRHARRAGGLLARVAQQWQASFAAFGQNAKSIAQVAVPKHSTAHPDLELWNHAFSSWVSCLFQKVLDRIWEVQDSLSKFETLESLQCMEFEERLWVFEDFRNDLLLLARHLSNQRGHMPQPFTESNAPGPTIPKPAPLSKKQGSLIQSQKLV